MLRSVQNRLNTNSIIGLFLLLALFSLAGDETIRFIASQIPGADEATPCRWLPFAENPGNNQSLIGRAAIENNQPIQLRVRSSSLPVNPDQLLVIRILVINNSLGTIPFVYDPGAVIVGDNGTSGLGIVFNPPSNIFTPGVNLRNDPATYPSNRIRILGPQQRCIHKMEFTFNELDNNIRSGAATVQAYYRGTNRGAVPAANPTPIYPDQGLWTGVVQSPAVPIPLASP